MKDKCTIIYTFATKKQKANNFYLSNITKQMKRSIFAVAVAAVLVACCGNDTKLTKGNASKMDTLSYALGANIATGIGYQMSDVPFDVAVITKGIEEGAFEQASQTHEEAIEQLRDYFMTKRGARAQEIAKKRAEADSIRLAEGDTTKVEYPVADEAMFESEEEREAISYAFGQDIGVNLRNSGYELQVLWVCNGFREAIEGNAQMDENAVNNFLQNYFMVVLPAKNLEASQKWLSKIEKKSGVEKTESGLLYKVIKAGEELKATDDRDVVKVHYTGRTREGKVFDTSIFANRPKEQQEMILAQNPEAASQDEPVEFPLNRVIAGWTEGMKLVGKGGTIKLWIPAELAYGQRGAGRDIGPNEALEFEVELIDVVPYVDPEAAKAEEAAEEPAEEKTEEKAE